MLEDMMNEVMEKMEELAGSRSSNYAKGVTDMGNYVVELIEEMAYDSPDA